MAKSDFLMCTSRTLDDGDAEGVPNVILEAMASGLPVMSTISGSIGEVVSDRTAYVIESDESFQSMVKAAIDSPEDRLKRVHAARSLVEANWDSKTLIEARVSYFTRFQ
jgi:colanic acid/amylovoran biosynthesis glycosyltransferase